MTDNEMMAELQEVRHEISRLNRAAGHTVFNPAATVGLDRCLMALGRPLNPEQADFAKVCNANAGPRPVYGEA